MLKKNTFKIILSSLIILLPVVYGILMWNDLPDTMTTHWGADGNADGVGGKVFAVFGLPAILLALHLVCLLFTLLDKKQKAQNEKALGIVFWILPMISLLSNGIIYRAAFGLELNLALLVPALLGITMTIIGNYLPKVSQNRTLGIKISWTINNEENWNKTHRLAGKIWVACGLVMLLSIFLPLVAMLWVTGCVLVAMVVIPMVYSYSIYKRHQKEGIVYSAPEKSKAEKIAARISAVVVTLLLIGVAVLMVTGNITVDCGDSSFTINATYWTDLTVDYSEIDTVEYREDLDPGLRTSGFASARLSLGIFQNDDFGSYTLYAYTGAEAYIVITSGEKTLVIGLADAEETQSVYHTLLAKASP